MRLREKIALALTDFFLVMFGVVIALGLRLDFKWDDMSRFLESQIVLLGVPVLSVIAFWLFGLYEKVWRYAGTHELSGVVLAVTIAVSPFQVLVLVSRGYIFPRTGLALAWMVCIFICGGTRLLLRMFSESLGRPITNTRVIIVGVNDSAESLARELTRSKSYTLVGFVDDNPSHSKLRIRGVPVLGQVTDLPRLIDAHLATEVILSGQKPAQVRAIMGLCEGKQVHLRTAPSLTDVVEGRLEVSGLRPLSIEDLLERDPIQVNVTQVAEFLRGKVVLITGAGGSIGSEIARQVTRFEPARLVLLGRGENSLYEVGLELPNAEISVCDICRRELVLRLLREYRPQVVFHAAAHKHVPMMEKRPAEAVYNNVFGTLTVMEACREVGVEKFVFLSTDKAVNPTSMMGASKRLAEQLVAKFGGAGYAAVRFGNVLGSRGSVVPTFRRQIAQGGPVTLTDPEMTRFFMTIPEAVSLVLQAAAMARGGEIYVLDMGAPVRIVDLARNLIRLSGFEPDKDIEIRFTGRRPGEKLDEELVNTGEETEPTQAPKVTRVSSPPPGGDWPGIHLEQLKLACQQSLDEECRQLVQTLVSNYQPLEN